MPQLTMEGNFRIVRQPVALPCVQHSHDFLELAYISRGWVMHAVGREQRRLEEGDFVLIDFGEVHGYEYGSENLEIINCLFQPALVDPSLRDTRSFSALLCGCMLGIGQASSYTTRGGIRRLRDTSGRIRGMLEAMLEEAAQERTGYYVMLRLLVTSLVIEVARKAELPLIYRPGGEIPWIQEQIRRQPDGSHSLVTYAHQFRMRPEALGRLFYQQTGERFLHYLRRRRVETACRLLAESSLSVPVVAEKCGYGDEKSFRAAFRDIMGMSPAAYKSWCRTGKKNQP